MSHVSWQIASFNCTNWLDIAYPETSFTARLFMPMTIMNIDDISKWNLLLRSKKLINFCRLNWNYFEKFHLIPIATAVGRYHNFSISYRTDLTVIAFNLKWMYVMQIKEIEDWRNTHEYIDQCYNFSLLSDRTSRGFFYLSGIKFMQ